MTAHSKYRLHHSIGYHLSLAARLQERRLDGWMRPMGLTRTTWCILLAVANENLTRPSEIADFVGIDRTATSRALRQMEAEGLISRKSASTDRRMTEVSLSPKAQQLVIEGTPLAEENNSLITDSLDETERAELYRLLRKSVEGKERGLTQI
ncbi:MarR family winged helix-turn-helix transcriptional regulator [Actibacterium sp. XHP0104]|uniref:MarR family winged helix-turn-helix transcriptional regulator n=1 Tax=Actibacterium sp. XHP0104 TaxID=2984335 RepID=UPI0021E8823F|nr:MarR family transcriptional regulator [Actibacterium sp. XHP0104]MCV2881397.1 MarR family transcriptional regulator [Actibacterium sp. XHP0104]